MTYLKYTFAATAIIHTFFFFLPCLVNAQVFVKSGAQGANNGTSWTDAYTNLDTAINKTSSGEIWVAAGTYMPTVNFSYYNFPAFNINKNIALFGGFKGNETRLGDRSIDSNPTILSGDIGVAGNDLDNTPTVIAITGSNIDSTCILDGFTITKGYYTHSLGAGYDNAAVYIFTDIYNNGSPVVRNCTIKNNFGFSGAGIYVRSASPWIYNNLITNNIAYEGAGIYLDLSGNARVIGNRITNNECVGGYTHLSGGGIQIEPYCAPYIYGNLIDNNKSGTYGGGISVESNYSAVITNNIISNNTSRDGGGIYVDFTSTDIINNLIIGNKATRYGGGMYVNYSFATRSVNNTIVSNSAENNGGAVYLMDGNMAFTNTIIYNNPTKNGKQFCCFNPNRTDWFPKISYCDIEDGKQGIEFNVPNKIDSVWRIGNIAVYPNFIDTTSANYRLPPQSACIDAGKPDTTGFHLPITDIAGASRFSGNGVDIGCYEFDPLFVSHDSLKVLPGNVNLQGRADSTFSFSIYSNTNWSVASKPDWVTIGNTTGTNPSKLLVTATANPNIAVPRSGKIIFSMPGIMPPVNVQINQTGSAYLTLTPDTIYINANQNDSAFFNVSSNLSWSLNSQVSWLSFNNYYSFGDGTVKVTATANKSGASRIAQMNVRSNNYNINPAIIKSVVIIQNPGFFTLCQNGSDSLSAGLFSPVYQWQANTGSGFVGITDNAYYNGTNSKFLKLINIPSSFNGYQYRCVTGNFVSEYYSLFIQNSWQGLVNGLWENPLNWSCGLLPDSNTNVIISNGNVFVNANTTIRTLKIYSPATLTVTAGVNLTILE